MTVVISELVLSMMDPVMFSVTNINESVVTSPAVGVDDDIYRDATVNNGL